MQHVIPYFTFVPRFDTDDTEAKTKKNNTKKDNECSV